MRAEFYRRDGDEEVIATAMWTGRRVRMESDDVEARKALERIFRIAPVVVDDGARRSLGAHGESVVQPGNLDWFRAAAFLRAPEEGLAVRLVPEVEGQGGWDPAAAYRTFEADVTRLLERDAAPTRAEPEG